MKDSNRFCRRRTIFVCADAVVDAPLYAHRKKSEEDEEKNKIYHLKKKKKKKEGRNKKKCSR